MSTSDNDTESIGPEIDTEEIEQATEGESPPPEESEEQQPRTRTAATGRSSNFVAPLRSAGDADAIAQRVAQQALVAYQRGEADTIEVSIREAVTLRETQS